MATPNSLSEAIQYRMAENEFLSGCSSDCGGLRQSSQSKSLQTIVQYRDKRSVLEITLRSISFLALFSCSRPIIGIAAVGGC